MYPSTQHHHMIHPGHVVPTHLPSLSKQSFNTRTIAQRTNPH